jgi:tetratricopeptide (TPR) repeat protein
MRRPGGLDSRYLYGLSIVLGLTAVAAASLWLIRSSSNPKSDDLAAAAYSRNEWPAAEKAIRERLKRQGDEPESLRLLARALLKQRRDEPALAIYERLGEAQLDAEDLFLLGEAILRMNRRESAILVWRKALGKDESRVEIWLALEQIFSEMDLLKESARAAEKIATLPGWEARGQLLLAKTRTAQGNPAAAAAAYRIALERPNEWHGMSSQADVRTGLARALLQTGQPEPAREVLSHSKELEPTSEIAWLKIRCDVQEGKPSNPEALAASRAYRESHPLEPEPAIFVGEERCADCHSTIYQPQHKSRHARTFPRGNQLEAIPFPTNPVADPINKSVTHEFSKSQGPPRVKTTVDGRVFETIIDYAFGSGDRGLTLVGHDRGNKSYECRMSYYGEDVGWDVTSGHPLDAAIPDALYQGMELTTDAVRRCLVCHSTHPHAVLSRTGPEAADRAIGCERCHGPGGNHLTIVALLDHGTTAKTHAPHDADLGIARPSMASGAAIVQLCSQCHSPRDNKIKLSPGSPDSVRFQGTTLTWSRCFTESQNKLDCVTCHNPHTNASTTASWYESRCRNCHNGETQSTKSGRGHERVASTVCPINPVMGCIQCHMPKVETVMSHARFTDHFIRTHPAEEKADKHAARR